MSDAGRGGGLRPLQTSLEKWTPGRSRAIDPLHAIAAAWPGIVGANVAAHSMPLELANGTLIVGTRSSAWSQQLQFLSLQVLEKLRPLASGSNVERLTFRVGLVGRRRPRPDRPAVPQATRRLTRTVAEPPASDAFEALARLRARMTAATNVHAPTCAACGAVLEDGGVDPARAALCAPCRGESETARRTHIERLVYLTPWLVFADLREQLPDLTVAEFERARKVLLARWWLVLERARLAGKVSASGLERHVGSSYVLLQSRLPPDRITSAVVRNLLGAELEAILWPHAAEASPEAR